MQANFDHCTALVREADRDRYLAALLAPAEHRDALFALYAFNVEIGRVRELAREPMPGEIRLQWWREMLSGERDGEAAAHPVAAALRATLAQHKLPHERLLDLIEARSFDLYDDPMGSFAELQGYAVRTAGTIYEFAIRILAGDIGTAGAGLAVEAGQAHRITSVLVNFPRHAARRQLYVPLEALQNYGADYHDVFAMRASTEVRAALAAMRLQARSHLTRVGDNASMISSNAWPALLPLAPLRPMLLAMEQAGYDPFRPPVIAPWRRQWHIWRASRDIRRLGG
jgi:15-cis-phytoene synthase